ncbi:hypothetical protein J2741_002034 [Methanolinea mesophila]|uniref:hypothetical protein n=1 Tax=Methanolinea mesophila TaxID=547055 RepID=UPI001AEAA80B|nr:hypothetical protein [Methanolinea mesophila]MBP1929487.1 hypothetical protein [Methanolinea mesophila]
MKKFGIIIIAVLFTFFLTLGAAAYASDFGKSEMVHFKVAVPGGVISKSTIVRGGGAPIEMAPIMIDLQQRGNLKKVLNPDIEGISTHTITNVGKTPVRIRVELVNISIPVRWEMSANLPYDPDTRTFLEPLPPGESVGNLGIDWFFQIPGDRLYNEVVCEGGLLFSDADSGEMLTFLPITIVNGKDTVNTTGGECH